MWLVFCDSTDAAALWAYHGLNARGLAPLELVTPERLAERPRWNHRLGAKGVAVELALGDGLRIRGDRTRGVLNRLGSIPAEPLRQAHADDRDYAAQEVSAFFMSWLHGLPHPVINRSTAHGLAGSWRHISEWMWLAAQVGLPIPQYRQTSHDSTEDVDWHCWRPERPAPETLMRTIFVLEGQIAGAPPSAELRDACQRLASLAGAELLGIDFTVDSAGLWTFAGASPLPDLRLGGEAMLDALARSLGRASGLRR